MSQTGAIILAGGQSSRMGQDKAALLLGGQTLLERLIRVVSPLVAQLVVMLSTSQTIPELPEDFLAFVRFGHDSIPTQGPLQGISDALPLFDPDLDTFYILSCDLPYLRVDVLEQMRKSLTPDLDGVCAESAGRTNPLLAVYRRHLLEKSIPSSAAGRSCMILIDDNRILRFPPPADNQHVFDDINTPDGYYQAQQHWDGIT